MAQPKRVNSLIRGLEILESFTPGESQLTLQDLAGRTGLPKTTVHRFLKTLLTMNYVSLDSRTKAYTLAPRVMALGFSALSGMSLREIAFPYMQNLSKAMNQNVNLAVLDRTEILYIERITVRRIINTNLYVGSRVNCYLTAMGRSLAAFLSREKYERLIQDLVKDKDAVKHIGKHGEKFDTILEEVRARGYSINNNDWVPGLRAIGAPIFSERGEVEASLSMSFVSQEVSYEDMLENYVPPLLEAAARISTVLGFDGHARHLR